ACPDLARGRGGCRPAAAELVIVDVGAQHDDSRTSNWRATATLALERPRRGARVRYVRVRSGSRRGMGRGLPENEAEERAALLGNLAEPVLVGRGMGGRGQADIADDMLAVGGAAHRPQDHDGG